MGFRHNRSAVAWSAYLEPRSRPDRWPSANAVVLPQIPCKRRLSHITGTAVAIPQEYSDAQCATGSGGRTLQFTFPFRACSLLELGVTRRNASYVSALPSHSCCFARLGAISARAIAASRAGVPIVKSGSDATSRGRRAWPRAAQPILTLFNDLGDFAVHCSRKFLRQQAQKPSCLATNIGTAQPTLNYADGQTNTPSPIVCGSPTKATQRSDSAPRGPPHFQMCQT
jgi:hypothetical protein